MRTYNKRTHDIVWSLLARMTSHSKFAASALEIAGHVASYTMWLRARGMKPAKRYRGREAMWRDAMRGLESGTVVVLEFGVAGGAATQFWLSRLTNPHLRWLGFDTFAGLPDAWTRGGVEFAAGGTFDAAGMTPPLDDHRITWHVGRVAETLANIDVAKRDRLVVLFDLDLYEPTAFALAWLESQLRPGDLLYFDEAYDPWHERKVIDEFLERGHRVNCLGATGIALMLEYEGAP